jgi:hypothetical protein
MGLACTRCRPFQWSLFIRVLAVFLNAKDSISQFFCLVDLQAFIEQFINSNQMIFIFFSTPSYHFLISWSFSSFCPGWGGRARHKVGGGRGRCTVGSGRVDGVGPVSRPRSPTPVG